MEPSAGKSQDSECYLGNFYAISAGRADIVRRPNSCKRQASGSNPLTGSQISQASPTITRQPILGYLAGRRA